VYGWCVVGPMNEIRIPPEAYAEYGFQRGETVLITPGSRHSGGFGIAKAEKLALSGIRARPIGQAAISSGYRVVLPPLAGAQPAERLLVVRGSWLALSFVQRGPIFDEALIHDEIQVFLVEKS